MKIKLIIIVFLFLGIKSFGQFKVTDPANTLINKATFAKNAAILTKATASLEETRKSVRLLSEAKDAVEKVSTVIKDMNSLYNIINMQNRLIIKSEKDINNLKKCNLFSTREIINASSTFSTIVHNTSKSVDLIQKLVEDNVFKMSDAERFTLIRDVETDVKTGYTEILYFSTKYNGIMNRRIIKKIANKSN